MTNYSEYRQLACAIIHDGVQLYKKGLREGYYRSTRQYLNNPFFQTIVQIIMDCSVDELLDEVERRYAYEKHSVEGY